MSGRTCLTIVLAAGEGTRMRSSRPKVLHAVAGRSLLGHVLTAAGNTAIAVVLGPEHDDVSAEARLFAPDAQVFVQAQRRGTAHAVLAAKAAIEKGADDILVIFGDTPLIRPQTLEKLRAALADGAAVAVLGFRPADPTGYGRLVTQGDGIARHRRARRRHRAAARHRALQRRADGVRRQGGAENSGANRQCQSQKRILSDRCGGNRAKHEAPGDCARSDGG